MDRGMLVARVLRRLAARSSAALLLAALVQLAAGAPAAEAESPSPTATSTSRTVTLVTPSPTATATASPTPQPSATATRAPTATPSPTPTPLPAQDLGVAFFNNFCEAGQPLLVTVFNTSATPLQGRTLRLSLSSEEGVLEEHDHYLSLEALTSVSLPLANTAHPPWVEIEIELLGTPADPNAANDSSSCGVAAVATMSPTAEPSPTPQPGAPPVGGGATRDAVRRTAASPTPPPVSQVQPTRPPARAQANSPQPSLTPIGGAGGGLAQRREGGLLPSRTLMLAAVVLLASGSSWAVYYFTKPPRHA